MPTDNVKVISHIPNSAIVQVPGRRFPGIVMQGDTLANVLRHTRFLLGEFKRLRDEERYYETLAFAEELQSQLLHYEETLENLSMERPYAASVKEQWIKDDYDA